MNEIVVIQPSALEESASAGYAQPNPALSYLEDSLHAESGRRSIRNYLKIVAGGKLGDDGQWVNGLWGTNYSIEDAPWHTLRAWHLEGMVTSMLAAGRKHNTINVVLAALKGVAKKAEARGLLSADVMRRILDVKALPTEDKREGLVYSVDQLNKVLEACDLDPDLDHGARDKALLAVCRLMGLRACEAKGLTVADVKDGGRTIRVNRKGAKAQSLPVPDKARIILNAWLARRSRTPGPVFCRIRKGPEILPNSGLHFSSIWAIFAKRAAQAGLVTDGTHGLRRTFATSMHERGADIVTIQHLMGHAKPETTVGYIHAATKAKKARETVDSIDLTIPQGTP